MMIELIAMNETHLYIHFLAVRMKYIELSQALTPKLVLGSTFCPIFLSIVMTEIMSSPQPFETSALKFNLNTGYFLSQ